MAEKEEEGSKVSAKTTMAEPTTATRTAAVETRTAAEKKVASTTAAVARVGRRTAPSSRAAKDVIPVFFTIDDSYAPYMGVAIDSLLSNASPDRSYEIVVLYQSLSDDHRAKVDRIMSGHPNARLRYVPMRKSIEGITNRYCNKLRQDYFTLTIFFRLFIPEMFPEYDKGIYLDSDIVVPGDISQMYEIDLGGNLLGGCRDLSVRGVPELVDYINRGTGVGIDNYINSGVLLMNLKGLREAGLAKRFLELLATYHFENLAPDQDYLNVLCKGKITYLDPSWDAMPVIGQQEMESPNIIHYNLFAKPWCYEGIPYADYFWKFAQHAGFADEAKANLDGYTEEQRQSDTACQIRMAKHGAELADAKFNFRVAFESGQEERL